MKFVCAWLSLVLISVSAYADEPCTYSDWDWDVNQKKAVNFREIKTTRNQLTPRQMHPDLLCSVCEEDMSEIKIENNAPFKVCRVVAPAMEDAIRQSINEGFRFYSLTGYRVAEQKVPLIKKAFEQNIPIIPLDLPLISMRRPTGYTPIVSRLVRPASGYAADNGNRITRPASLRTRLYIAICAP